MQLHVRVLEARGLARMDGLGKSDPYLILNINNNDTRKTSVQKNTLTPHWNEEFTWSVTNPACDFLHIHMKDKDVAFDDSMATIDLHLNGLPLGVVVDHWYPLAPAKKVKKGGELHLVIHLANQTSQPFVSAPLNPIPNTPCQLHVRLIEGRDVPKMDSLGKTDPYCVLTISGNQRKESKFIKNTYTPKWNEDFHFDVPNPQSDVFKILMRDKDVKFDDDISTYEMETRFLPFHTVSDMWVNMRTINDKIKYGGGRIHLLLHFAPRGQPAFVAQQLVPSPAQPTTPTATVQQAATMAVQQPGMIMQQSPMVVQQPAMAMQQPTMTMQQPTMTMTMQQPTMPMQQPAMTMTMQQPTMPMQQPAMMMQQPTMPMQQPSMMMQQPTMVAQPYGAPQAPPVSFGAPPPPPVRYGAPPPPSAYGAPPPPSAYGAPPPPSAYGAPPPPPTAYGAPPPQYGYGMPPSTPGQPQYTYGSGFY